MSQPGWVTLPPPASRTTYAVQMNPAYNTVQAPRMSFNYAAVPPPQYSNGLPPPPGLSTAPIKKKKVEWPDSVRDYVRRAFDPQCVVPGVTKQDIEKRLKDTISAATDSNTLNSIDWANMLLPQHMIQAEALSAASNTWQQASIAAYNGANSFQTSPLDNQSKKRKSTEIGDIASPPWRTNSRGSFEDRITLPTPTQKKANAMTEELPLKTSKFQKNLEKRQRRFDGGYVSKYRSPSPEAGTGPVVGRCETLEKRYLRLTAAPNPEVVRPLHILKQTLELLKKKWRKEGNYSYICDQFKSLRQDLTVQHIKDKFTVEVYEIHARIALEKGDLGEYNQCQTQLRALYAQNLGGNPVEFKAYRILYLIHTANRTSLNDVLADLTPVEKKSEPIKHALSVRSALALGNYHKFFRLYLETPNMGAYLMDMFVVRERLAALSNICRAYKPAVPLRFITEELGFESDQDAATFVCEQNGQDLLEQKDEEISFLSGKAGQIFELARREAFRKVDIKGQI